MKLKLDKRGHLLFSPALLPYKDKDEHEIIDLVLDTGAGLTIIETAIVDALGYSAGRDGIGVSTLDGAAGKSEGYVIQFGTFECLGILLNDFKVACHDMNSRLGVSGLLGMNFLQHLRIDLDYSNGLIHQLKRVVEA